MEFPTDVNTYITVTKDGLPDALRPLKCEACMSERIPHRHGCFWRWVFLLTGEFHIRMFRFYCPHCDHTMSVCPPFIEPHYPYAYEVQEAAVDLHEHGKSFEEVAEDETIILAGPVHIKTVWRWYKRWMQRVHLHHDSLWKILLHYNPTVTLPKHTTSNWRNLMNAWSIVRQRLKHVPTLFVYLGQLARSRSMTVIV